jgi:hypothetical protein
MAIFYTPVKYKPTILLVGDNPGGTDGNIWNEPPKRHDYFLDEDDDYRFAKKMRQIFSGEVLTRALQNSVKINRVFFQSKSIKSLDKDFNWGQLENFCFEFVKQIIQKLEPKLIIAESVGSFNSLIYNFKGTILNDSLVRINNKNLLRAGLIDKKLILGIMHPTSARGISNEQWKLVTNKLNEIIH